MIKWNQVNKEKLFFSDVTKVHIFLLLSLSLVLVFGLDVEADENDVGSNIEIEDEWYNDEQDFVWEINGTYNGIIESQIFYRRIENPVFIGGFIFIEKPISESDFGYLPSTITTISLSTSFMNFDQRESSIDYGLSLVHVSQSYWNNLPTPNSKSLTIIPNIGYLFNSIIGGVSFNIQKPFYISGAFASNEGDIEQTSSIWQLSFSVRFMPRSN